MVWYYQFTPGETHDIDDAFENVLIDHDWRSSLFKMGRLGILWELDRKTRPARCSMSSLCRPRVSELLGNN